ncbi:MAG TPA: hypothetical protein VIP07_10685 [Candidatus Limnocylindria bacterium]
MSGVTVRTLVAATIAWSLLGGALPTSAWAAPHAGPSGADCVPSTGPGIPPPASVPSGLPGFHAAWFGQSGYPTLCPGQRASAVVAYYNSGTRGWVQGKMGEVAYLGTWDPEPGQDRMSALGGDGTLGSPATGWPRYNRVASQPAAWVGPNQVAWFQFQVVAPTVPGTYRLSIRPLIEGAQWMEDYGVFWYVTVGGTAPAGSVAPLPSRWPSRALEIGMTDEPGEAGQLRSSTPLRLRYTYLAGGVNTGQGWATWNPGGGFVTSYIQESAASGFTPVFSYYMLRQSSPGNGMGELAGDTANLANTSTMSAFFADLKLFFQRAGAFSSPVVLHVEPDLWGYVQQGFGDDATAAPARVRSTGMAELAGLPDSVAGVARGIVKLRDTYAPNVLLGYHLSVWGTNVDPLYSKPTDAEIDSLATRSASFYRSLGAAFDISFAEFSDADAAFKRAQSGDDAAWWNPDDFARNVRYLGRYSTVTQQRIVMWQIPLGNTRMRAENNTWDHYQDNKVEWLLDEPGRANLGAYSRAGVIAFLFGRGGDGSTCACDAAGDGVTNPAPIGANTRSSLNADDDGGYFRERAAVYYANGALVLP